LGFIGCLIFSVVLSWKTVSNLWTPIEKKHHRDTSSSIKWAPTLAVLCNTLGVWMTLLLLIGMFTDLDVFLVGVVACLLFHFLGGALQNWSYLLRLQETFRGSIYAYNKHTFVILSLILLIPGICFFASIIGNSLNDFFALMATYTLSTALISLLLNFLFSRQLLRLTTESCTNEWSSIKQPDASPVVKATVASESSNEEMLNVPSPSTYALPNGNWNGTSSLTLSTLNDSFFSPLLQHTDVTDVVLSDYQVKTIEIVTKLSVLSSIQMIANLWYLVVFICAAAMDTFGVWVFVLWICILPFDCFLAVLCTFLTYKFGKNRYDKSCNCCHQCCLKACVYIAKRKVKSNVSG